ncbi:MAG: hypothetical protein ACRDY4_14475 [Acidimicrobiia bacterium]
MALHHARPPGVTAAVAASFPDMSAARGAIEALEHAGIDGDEIDLLGQRADAARTPTSPARPDRRMARHILGRLGVGALIGLAAGAVAGVVLGLIVLAVTSSGGGVGLVVAFAIVGVGLGAVVSVFLSFERSVGLSYAWPLTFEDVPEGTIWVAVYSRDPRIQDRAGDTLAGLRPLELRRDAG